MRAYNVSIKENSNPYHHGTCVELHYLAECISTRGSKTMNPRKIITGLMIDHNKHQILQFGEYLKIHESHDKSTGTAYKIESIALRQ